MVHYNMDLKCTIQSLQDRLKFKCNWNITYCKKSINTVLVWKLTLVLIHWTYNRQNQISICQYF